MTVDPSGFVDYSQPGRIPNIAQEESASYTVRDQEVTAPTFKPQIYKPTEVPYGSRADLWGTNGYFMNGPNYRPFADAQNRTNEILAYTQSWMDNAKQGPIKTFFELMDKYGATNNAGVLYSMAFNGVPDSSSVGKKLLALDAGNYSDSNINSGPMTAGSPSANIPPTPTEPSEPSALEQFAEPYQFALRNTFSALFMPLQAVQGAIRGIGGALTEEGGPDIGEAAAQVVSLLIPPAAAVLDGYQFDDNEFVNPWEQTDFGQQLIAMANGGGFDAFTTLTAGLDIARAKQELLQDPANVDLQNTAEGMAELDYKAEQLALEKEYYSRPGWFVDETSQIGEAQRRATFNAWAIPGPNDELTAWTLGRGIFSNIGGPDWAGYSVASGIVDAAASLFFDPITYVPFANIASWASKGTKVAGAFAKNAKKISVTNQQLLRAVEKSNPEYATAMRNAAIEFRTENGRQATLEEIEALVGPSPQFDAATLQAMALEEQMTLVRAGVEADLSAQAYGAAAPNTKKFKALARQARRQAGESRRIDRVMSKETKRGTFSAAERKMIEVWGRFAAGSFTADGRFSQQKYNKFAKDVLGYDRRTGEFNNLENYTAYQEAAKLQYTLMQRGFASFDDAEGSAYSVLQFMNDNFGRAYRKETSIDPARVSNDIADLYARGEPEVQLSELSQVDAVGGVLADEFVEGRPVVGMLDGAESVFYYTGEKPLRLADAASTVDQKVIDHLDVQLGDFLFETRMQFVPRVPELNSMSDQMAARVYNATEAQEALQSLLTKPNLTYQELFDFSKAFGLDSVLDDALRTVPRRRIDGIRGITGRTGRGIWVGNHPEVVAYSIGEASQVAGISVRGADDIDAALSGLQIVPDGITQMGYRGQSPTDLILARDTAEVGFRDSVDQIQQGLADTLVMTAKEQQVLDDALKALDDQFADPTAAAKSILAWDVGLRNSRTGGITLDTDQTRYALFGTGPSSWFANKTLEAMAEFIPEAKRAQILAAGRDSDIYRETLENAMAELALVTKNKWSAETYRAVANNAIDGGGKDGLLAILAPRLGIDVSKGSISRGLRSTGSDTKGYFRTWKKTNPVIERGLSKIPISTKLMISDSSATVDAILSYVRQAGIRVDRVTGNIGRVLSNAGTPGAAATNRNEIAAVFDMISEDLIKRLKDQGTTKALFKGQAGERRLAEIERAIKDNSTLWLNGTKETRTKDIQSVATDSDISKLVNPDGSFNIPERAIDTDIANGYVMLPTVDEWNKATNRLILAVSRMPVGENTYELARRFYDNFFRTSLLVFRVSYILRNAAEMQVRMFLNGHKSIVSDPATMIGMTIGNIASSRRLAKYNNEYQKTFDRLLMETGKAPKEDEVVAIVGKSPMNDAFMRIFAPYKDTVLGTSFEVGADDALATTNFVYDYYALTRLAHSLTDVRVYNSAVRQSLNYDLAYGTTGFNDGWAHELIMLERSTIAKGVAKTYTRQQQDDYVKWLTTSREAQNVRSEMIAFDKKFEEIFASPDYTRQYLYDLPNSVMNRIILYTNNDPQLIDFIATGTIRYGLGQRFRPGSVRTPEDRLKETAQILRQNFSTESFKQHFISNGVRMPNVVSEGMDKRQGFALVNKFFDISNQFERLGSVGPEFRMAYWDKIAELAPMLNKSEVDAALSAARTTLGPIKRLIGPSKFDYIGKNHPAFKALAKAKKNNQDGLFTLNEIHNMASSYAAEDVSNLFYDAAKRNNWWYALRLLFPFGQAWGNTVATWTGLAAKQPINVYKAAKAFNALTESGSSAIYELGSETNTLYGQYAPGFAPWEQNSGGGFFYTDAYGDTSFMLPLVGRAAALPLKLWGAVTGTPTPSDLPIQSPAQSLNFALGADSILPGVSGLAALPLAEGVLPDSEIVSNLRQIVQPFGERDVIQTAVPPWLSKVMSGMGAIPVFGDMFGPFVDSLSQSNKAAHVRDALLFLSTSGNYKDWGTNPETLRALRDDAEDLAKMLVLTTGLLQNVSPSTPVPQLAAPLELPDIDPNKEGSNTALYTVGMLNSLFQQYRVRNGNDDTAAREEFVRDFGPAALFASVGMWKNLTKIPTSDALKFARENPNIAKSNIDIFGYFFPGGDQSDVAAVSWAKRNGVGDRTRKRSTEILDEVVSYLQRAQTFRINSMESAGVINEVEAEAARDEVAQRYLETGSAVGAYLDKTQEMEQFNAFVRRYPEIRATEAGKAFQIAWDIRSAALRQVREQTGNPDAGLGSMAAEPVYNWYVGEINKIQAQYPNFRLLGAKFRREWL